MQVQVQWLWWLKQLLNIEVIFILTIIVVVIYAFWSKDRKRLESQLKSLLGIVDDGIRNSKYRASGKGKKRKSRDSGNKSEDRCREIFEGLFDKSFPSIRPDWLKNPISGQNLELDGYCADIKTPIGRGLAFEYDGEQHSRYNKHFHGDDPKKFVYQVKKDTYKDQRCKQKGVMLIRIPYYITYQELDMYIVQRLRKMGMV